jgi:site-specific recombinase XerC
MITLSYHTRQNADNKAMKRKRGKKGNAMNALITMNAKEPETMNAIAAELADIAGIDDLSTWTPTDILQALRAAKGNRRAEMINRKINIADIDWHKERETFLTDARSEHTRRAYSAALGRLEAWASREGVNPLELSPGQADGYIRELKTEARAAASVRRDIAAVSAFYTWLERYHASVKNPVRGTRIRPPNENKKKTVIPTAKEYKAIMSGVPPVERAILAALALRGLRAGALPTLEKKGEKYHGKSKGKILTEGQAAGITLPAAVLDAIQAAGLDIKKPFSWITANAIERRINYRIGKLFKAGAIAAPYSCHDLRHYYAVQEYKKDRDIVRVSKLLNHANISITQNYLRSLGVTL